MPRTGHAVRESFATTFPRLLQAARLTKARNLLALTELSVAEVARRCGYSEHRYFHRCFKQAEGQPPMRGASGSIKRCREMRLAKLALTWVIPR